MINENLIFISNPHIQEDRQVLRFYFLHIKEQISSISHLPGEMLTIWLSLRISACSPKRRKYREIVSRLIPVIRKRPRIETLPTDRFHKQFNFGTVKARIIQWSMLCFDKIRSYSVYNGIADFQRSYNRFYEFFCLVLS